MKQIKHLLCVDLITHWDEATTLPKNLREQLQKEVKIELHYKLVEDKSGLTTKALISLKDGLCIESVLMKYNKRNTICLSSQVGCPVGCSFCATGGMGYKRNLTAGEMILQVLLFARILKKEAKRISNVVFMGMGEPLLNYDNVIKAITFLSDKDGFNIGMRKISVSTVGIISALNELLVVLPNINIAISLHSASQEIRNKLIPVSSKFSLDHIRAWIMKYFKETNRKLMIEYVLLNEVNDSAKDARQLHNFVRKFPKNRYVINLINYNDTGVYKPSSKERIEKFRKILENEGIPHTERFRFGRSIHAGCGQLATRTTK